MQSEATLKMCSLLSAFVRPCCFRNDTWSLTDAQRRADLFDPTLMHSHFSMERFHINGSRVLSRSFHVEEWDPEGASDENDASDHGSPTNGDNEHEAATIGDDAAAETIDIEGDIEESDDGDKERVEHVAMVPMADILNARYGSENVCLPPICVLGDYSQCPALVGKTLLRKGRPSHD
jgi:hypothetical protein